jgi:F0F1-type ATP synthase assembly protein I
VGKKNRDFSLIRVTRALQDNVRRSGPAAGASYTLVGAILLLGGLGYLADGWAGTAPWGLFVGLTLGIVVGFYELVKTVWRR